MFFLFNCTKQESQIPLEPNKIAQYNSNTNYEFLSDYSKVLSIALVDLVENDSSLLILMSALTNESNTGDEFDYKISFENLSLVF